jgi:hypothetical protein
MNQFLEFHRNCKNKDKSRATWPFFINIIDLKDEWDSYDHRYDYTNDADKIFTEFRARRSLGLGGVLDKYVPSYSPKKFYHIFCLIRLRGSLYQNASSGP